MKKQEMEMDEQSIVTVLKEMLGQDIKTQQFMETEKEALQKRDLLLEQVAQRIESIKVEAPKPDLSEVIAAIDNGYQKIAAAIEKRPKPIERFWRIYLFPENNVREYYRMVFGRLFFWTLMFTVVIYIGGFINKGIDAYQANQYNKEGNASIAAWNEIYAQAGKSQREKMTNALTKAKHDQQ
jgi:hypothetical protein